MNPNFNLSFSDVTLVLLGGGVMSYFTHDGWWIIAGATFYVSSKIRGIVIDDDNWKWLYFVGLFLSIIFIAVAASHMGWF
jgi:hypothetical protein